MISCILCCIRCMESVPLLLRKSTFCSSFFAHARVFRTYQSWVLIMMLRQVHPALPHTLVCAALAPALSRHHNALLPGPGGVLTDHSDTPDRASLCTMKAPCLYTRTDAAAKSQQEILGITGARALVCMQAGLRVHTYPEVLFTAANLTAGGGDCNPDKPPLERHISFGSASNILGDPEEVRMALLSGIIIVIIIRLHLFQPLYHRCMSCCCTLGDPEEVHMAPLCGSNARPAAASSRWACLHLNALQTASFVRLSSALRAANLEVQVNTIALQAAGGCSAADHARHVTNVACASQVMTNLYLAPFPRPATSLIADYPYEQGHKGWQACVTSCTQPLH